MAEGGGHDVGTLRLRVVPYLDQAATQQIGQQLNGMLGHGGRGGIGGGGGGGWMPFAGGPGYGAGGAGGGPIINNIVNNAFGGPPAEAPSAPVPPPARGPRLGRMAMTTAFLGWELSRSVRAANEGEDEAFLAGNHPLVSARGAMKTYEEQTSGIIGSLGGLYQEMATNNVRRARFALHDIEETYKDIEAGGERGLASRKDRFARNDMGREGNRIGIRGSLDRAVQDAKDSVKQTRETIDTGRLQRMNARDNAVGPEATKRARAELDRFNDEGKKTAFAAEMLSNAQRQRYAQQDDREVVEIGLHGDAMAASAAGRRGGAAGLEFIAKQAGNLNAAYDRSAAQGLAQRRTNRLAAAANAAALNHAAAEAQTNTEAYNALSRGDVIGAMGIRAAQSRKDAIRNAPPGFASEYAAEADAEAAHNRFQFSLARDSRVQSLKTQQAALRVLASDTGPFGPMRAQVAGTVEGALGGSELLQRAGRGIEASMTLQNGSLSLKAFAAEILRGIKAEGVSDIGSVDAFRSIGENRPGNNIEKLLQEIAEGIKKLGVQ